MRALMIDVNFGTGERAGGIEPNSDTLLMEPTWQSWLLGKEMRLCPESLITKYEGKPGIAVIAEADIPDACQIFAEEQYAIASHDLVAESVKQKGIDITDLDSNMDDKELAKILLERGALGVKYRKRKPKTAAQVQETMKSLARMKQLERKAYR